MRIKLTAACTALGVSCCLLSGFTFAVPPKVPSSNQVLDIIKQQFGITVRSKAEANAFMAKQLTTCYQKLRECAPGQYKYAIPDPLAMITTTTNTNSRTNLLPLIIGTYTIKGFQGDKCLFADSYAMQGSAYLKVCKFQRDHLNVFTDKEAEASAFGNISYKNTDPTPLQQALRTECEIYINGQQTSLSAASSFLLTH